MILVPVNMTSAEFRKLSVFRQVEILLGQGQQFMGRIFLFYTIQLYVFDGLFVEIWYRQTSNQIDRVVILDLADVFDLYEKQITLGELPGIKDQ